VVNYAIGEQFTSYVLHLKAYDIVWEANTRFSEMVRCLASLLQHMSRILVTVSDEAHDDAQFSFVQALQSSGAISSEEYSIFPTRAPFVWHANESFVRSRYALSCARLFRA
jgi:hypothetical protein